MIWLLISLKRKQIFFRLMVSGGVAGERVRQLIVDGEVNEIHRLRNGQGNDPAPRKQNEGPPLGGNSATKTVPEGWKEITLTHAQRV